MKLSHIAEVIGADLEGDGALEVASLLPLDEAGPEDLSFLSNPRYVPSLETTRAAAVIVGRDVPGPGCALLRVDDPYMAFARALEIFRRPVQPEEGIDPSASIGEDVVIGAGARIAAHVSIGSGTRIGARATLHPGVRVYPQVTIGEDFIAHANVVIRERCVIGDRVLLLSGAAIGNDGFGNIPLPGGGVHSLPQIGSVEIGDDVSIGANSTVDRATIGATRIESGAKLDNLVMVAHGCVVGREALIAAQSGLAGSTTVGERVQLGGQVGAAGHLTIGEDSRVAAKTGITNDVPAQSTIAGYPHREAGRWQREEAVLRRLPELAKRLRRLEKATEEQ